ncbi:NYN domain-containing protein [Mobilicoccus caccae]|uniref:Nuclease n=1 Tax=Mobilicoccus caccae TaxID=1859295 RepID=A0ABQ6IY59_9MICO|nr:NYN domain-containing protein [Mobilicoccus caccae]GMA41624.1 nuclease [Mobilicoccus caccae]
MTEQAEERRTYLLIDGENLDATLGVGILERRPRPEERPRWERVLQFARAQWDQPVQGLFFLAARHELPMAFVQALISIGFRPIPLTGRPDEKVVDIAISRTLRALADRPADIMLASHDGDFLEDLASVTDGRRTGVIAFQEFRSQGYRELVERGLEFFDLEYDVQAFDTRLPRVRIIPIEEFDPLEFI